MVSLLVRGTMRRPGTQFDYLGGKKAPVRASPEASSILFTKCARNPLKKNWRILRASVFVTVCSLPLPAIRLVGIFVGIGRTNVLDEFRYFEHEASSKQMALKEDKHTNPGQIRTDVDCRAARPKRENGAVECHKDFRRGWR